MSKKNLKRSLALSALMAFVITGSAYAGVYETNTPDVAFSVKDSGIFPYGSIIAKEVTIDNSVGSAINAYNDVTVEAKDGDVNLYGSNYAIQTGVVGNGDNAKPDLKIKISGHNINLSKSSYGWVTKMEVGSTELIAENDVVVNGTFGLSNNSSNGTASVIAGGSIKVNATTGGAVSNNGAGWNLIADDSVELIAPKGQNAIYSNKGTVNVTANNNTVIEGNVKTSSSGSVKVDFNGSGSSLTGAVIGDGKSELIFNNGATWNVTGDSNLSVLAGSGANINVGDGVTSIKIKDNQNDDVNLSKVASGAVTKEDLEALKDIVEVDAGQEIKVDATMTNAYLTGDVTLDEAGLMNTKIDTDRFVVSGSVRANGITSLKDVYAFDGKGKFNSLNETAAGVEANKAAIETVKDQAALNDRVNTVQNKQIADLQSKDLAHDKAIAENAAAIKAEANAREAADNQLQANIDAEATARENADNNLQSQIDSVKGQSELNDRVNTVQNKQIADLQSKDLAHDKAIAENAAAIKAEATTREAADNQLQANIDAEATARENADNNLQSQIDSVKGQSALNDRVNTVQNKQIADLQSKDLAHDKAITENADAIEAEVAAREASDAKLQANIDAEATARENADTTLQNNIDTVQDNLNTQANRLDNRIDKVDAKIDKVGAMAAAMASLKTMGYDPEAPTEIAVGVGQYRNETGLAIGAFHYPNKNFMLNFSLSTAGDEVMGGVGATWKIGRKKPAGETMEDKVAKAEAMKEAAKAARVKAQQARHAKMLAEKSK